MIFETALMCLALNIFHEAAVEPLEGQVAVAQVTINRANNDNKNVCKVVLEPKQFSWANSFSHMPFKQRLTRLERMQKKIAKSAKSSDKNAWKRAINIARQALTGKLKTKAKYADFYYNPSLANPRWRFSMKVVCRIGNHIFLRSA